MQEKIIKDLEIKLNKRINEDDIFYYNDGVSGSLVFKIKDEYLVKTVKPVELETYKKFFEYYKKNYFQQLVCYNEELLYVCFKYIPGRLFKEIDNIDSKIVIKQLYNIVQGYKTIDYNGYGYLYENNIPWLDFLKNELDNLGDIDITKLINAYKIIEKEPIPKYLIHGDFGTHNFIVNNGLITVIDPMPVVGDPLYDFYFAIFSNVNIFHNLDLHYILSFFKRDINYKKALLTICFYIRLKRAYKYDKDSLPVYLDYLKELKVYYKQ